MSRPSAVIDACVLVPMPLADTLLRLAARDLFRIFWSKPILDELRRTLLKFGYSDAQAHRRLAAMMEFFPEALVDLSTQSVERYGLPDPDDDHILAAAICSRAQSIVTLNLKDFPAQVCGSVGVEVVHPDEFLVRQFAGSPGVVIHTLIQQAQATSRPPMELNQLLDLLSLAAPVFVDLLQSEIPRDL